MLGGRYDTTAPIPERQYHRLEYLLAVVPTGLPAWLAGSPVGTVGPRRRAKPSASGGRPVGYYSRSCVLA